MKNIGVANDVACFCGPNQSSHNI